MMLNHATDMMVDSVSSEYSNNDSRDAMIMRNFEKNSPVMVLPGIATQVIESEFFDVAIMQAVEPPSSHASTTEDDPGAPTKQTNDAVEKPKTASPQSSRGVFSGVGMSAVAENMLVGLINCLNPLVRTR